MRFGLVSGGAVGTVIEPVACLLLHRNVAVPYWFLSVANTTTGLPLQHTFYSIAMLANKATRASKSPVAAGPRANPETRPVAELAHAMWFDSQEDTLEFLLKAGLEPEQSSTGTWQLVLHRSLRVDPQVASFRQRSGRLCNQQAAPRCQSVNPCILCSQRSLHYPLHFRAFACVPCTSYLALFCLALLPFHVTLALSPLTAISSSCTRRAIQ